ncbi:MAG: precorrin-2 dehydrogenase/sirohydrochlorin ferrochelatase family protein [Oligoflexus sp.]
MSSLLPIFLDLQHKPVLVIGGGSTALEKLEKLVKTGANIEVIAKHFSTDTADFLTRHGIASRQDEITEADLKERFLVISAVNDTQKNQEIAALARKNGVLINAVDEPSACDFYFSAQIERGPLQIAISTRGLFPGLARSIRLWLEKQFPPEIIQELNDLVEIRDLVKEKIPDPRERMQALRQQLQIWMYESTSRKTGDKR